MLKLESFGLGFRSKRSCKADNAAGIGKLKMACMVSALCAAACYPRPDRVSP